MLADKPMDLRSLPHTETMSGFSFVATADEVAAMDLLVGPTRPMLPRKRGGRRVMVRDCVHPHRHHPWFFDVLISVIAPETAGLRLELVRSDNTVALYRFPPRATDVLSTFTPERAEFVGEEINAIAKRATEYPEVCKHYKEGGVRLGVHMMRGDALKAVPRGSGKEAYYWCYRTTDAHRLRKLSE